VSISFHANTNIYFFIQLFIYKLIYSFIHLFFLCRPYTEETLVELGASGVKNLVVVPVSFVSEHIETLVSYRVCENTTYFHI
jgi:cell shape-determining protein MreC